MGDGFDVAKANGSSNNDAFIPDGETGQIKKKTNHAGGILGGISDGAPIIFRAAIKPTPSIGRAQKTVTRDGKETTIEIVGRHDPAIVPRAVVVVECMAAITILDLMMENLGSRIDAL